MLRIVSVCYVTAFTYLTDKWLKFSSPVTPSPPVSNLLSVSQVCLLWAFPIKGILGCVAFCLASFTLHISHGSFVFHRVSFHGWTFSCMVVSSLHYWLMGIYLSCSAFWPLDYLVLFAFCGAPSSNPEPCVYSCSNFSWVHSKAETSGLHACL